MVMKPFNIFTTALRRVWDRCHQPRTDREQAALEFVTSASRWVRFGVTWNTQGRLWGLL
jgi:hypothetical protein